MKKRSGKHYWQNLLRDNCEHNNEQFTSTYKVIPGSRPMPSESGHEGVINECDLE